MAERLQTPQVKGVNVVIGIPSFGMVSTWFMTSLRGQQFPLVSSAIDKIVLNKPIAEARNEIVQFALDQGANYIYWLDDDVIAPPNAFLNLYRHHKDIINGVYWSKSNPPMPLLFRGHLDGPYWDWHVGDLIEIDAAGSGLTVVKTDVYRNIEPPWYSTEYVSFPGVPGTVGSPPNNTEDLYFYWKAKKAGYQVWADTSVQALHFEKNSGVLYGMPPNAPQAFPAWEVKPKGSKLIADIGSGPVSPYMRDEGEVVSFDIREEVKPDIICDVRYLPVPTETFDIVFSSHTLEHFSWTSIHKVLAEWTRILKVGGELRIVVPNLKYSAQRILDDQMHITDLWTIYGEQEYPKNFHAVGFTPNTLKALVESMGVYDEIEVKEGNYEGPPSADSWNLQIKAKKVRSIEIDNITPDWVIKAPDSLNQMPVPIFPEQTVRPMDEKEIATDAKKAKESKVSATVEEAKKELVEGAKKRSRAKNSADLAAFSEKE